METRKDGNGFETFVQHWGFTVLAAVAGLGGSVFFFFLNLRGPLWDIFFITSFALMISGGALIRHAKRLVDRKGQFFTFGAKSVPTHLVGYYRWGWRVSLLGFILALGLLISRA